MGAGQSCACQHDCGRVRVGRRVGGVALHACVCRGAGATCRGREFKAGRCAIRAVMLGRILCLWATQGPFLGSLRPTARQCHSSEGPRQQVGASNRACLHRASIGPRRAVAAEGHATCNPPLHLPPPSSSYTGPAHASIPPNTHTNKSHIHVPPLPPAAYCLQQSPAL